MFIDLFHEDAAIALVLQMFKQTHFPFRGSVWGNRQFKCLLVHSQKYNIVGVCQQRCFFVRFPKSDTRNMSLQQTYRRIQNQSEYHYAHWTALCNGTLCGKRSWNVVINWYRREGLAIHRLYECNVFHAAAI